VVLVERRLQPPRDILDFVRSFNELVLGIDSVIREIDITLRSLDGALRMNPTLELPPLETRQEVPSPSFPGQSPIDYCVPPGSLVHTADGLKPIESVREGDLVLTHRGVFRRVTKVFVRPYKGKLISIKCWGCPEPILLTPNHPVYVRDKKGRVGWVEASKVNKNMWVYYPHIRVYRDIPEVTENLAKLIGVYLAEGTILFTNISRRPFGIRLAVGNKEDYVRDVINVIEELGLRYKVRRFKNCVYITITNFMLADFIYNNFGYGEEGKKIPLWFKLLPVEKLLAMLEFYWRGYGSVYSKGGLPRVVMFTVSRQLAYDIRDIALKVGFIPMMSVVPERDLTIEGKRTHGRKIYRVEIRRPVINKHYQKYLLPDNDKYVEILKLAYEGYSRRQIAETLLIPKSTVTYNISQKYGGFGLWMRVKEVKEVDYDGYVYNLEVEGDHSYAVGGIIVHNCFECLSRHYEKALGLLEEAHRFSLSAGRVTEGAREKIRKAFHEIVTSEDDLGTRVEDPEVKPILDEIKVKVREFRKWLWASGLLTHETDVRKLEEVINRFRSVVDLTWKGAEIVASKRLPLCGYCENLAREVSERYGISFDEARKLIYGLASDDKEEVRRSIERVKEIGAFEYVFNRVKEILGEMGGG
jgi:hypothetical protein